MLRRDWFNPVVDNLSEQEFWRSTIVRHVYLCMSVFLLRHSVSVNKFYVTFYITKCVIFDLTMQQNAFSDRCPVPLWKLVALPRPQSLKREKCGGKQGDVKRSGRKVEGKGNGGQRKGRNGFFIPFANSHTWHIRFTNYSWFTQPHLSLSTAGL